jgi:hypothetical protein
MASRSFVTFHLTLVAAMLAAGPIYGAPDRTTDDVLHRFEQSIQQYMTVHRAVERQLPALTVTADARAIDLAITMRAAGMRLARATARQGDIFAPETARVFRARIIKALESHDYLVADLLLPADEDGDAPPPPVVNGTFAWRTAIATPPCVLATLPSLPEELQYRFVGRDLVLVDIEANLIVDVLPDVL